MILKKVKSTKKYVWKNIKEDLMYLKNNKKMIWKVQKRVKIIKLIKVSMKNIKTRKKVIRIYTNHEKIHKLSQKNTLKVYKNLKS